MTPKALAAAKYSSPESNKLKNEFRELLQTDIVQKPLLSSADKKLFEQEMHSVQPLTPSGRQLFPPLSDNHREQHSANRLNAVGTDVPVLVLAQTSDHYISPLFEDDPTEFLSPACGTDVMRNLKKGRWPILASLDLHGATLDDARVLVSNFVDQCIEHRIKCVRIVHGVGYGSKGNGPILLPTVRRWLAQLHDVLAYTECAPHEGGKGAVKIVLRTYR
ncbi:Smr/MutS family protein [Paenalcaligenes niemegkensis]|uniref:Smr/MutS family protein n=1 Tax=Paenalcaligenes niemegkensis TaxID=2895469 RepID=UPI001EE8A8E7|nr:Smr/MutS family protein [Paenalcaligenes niemegkensis]MCQ9616964.1 Smr/MutS family protein [Paenalcaligenes niemegkensis]